MKTLVIYYSYTGKTKRLAEKEAKKRDGNLIEVQMKKRPSTIGAYVAGSFRAMRCKKAEVKPFAPDYKQYDHIVILAPIWAGYPAPAFNNIVESLPKGKQVELIMTSGSGNSSKSKEHSKALIEKRKSTVTGYTDIKS